MTLLQALVNSNGSMAQFNHSELGGGGQWMRGGMTMVGDMFNYGLKSKVDGLCSELSQLLPSNRSCHSRRVSNRSRKEAVSSSAATWVPVRSACLSQRRPAVLRVNGGRRNWDFRTVVGRRTRSVMPISMRRIGSPWN